MHEKPLKPVRGKLKPYKPHERPKHLHNRKIYNLRCAMCGYKARHRLYVCPTCGGCQFCGILNPTGNVNQSCQVCGNGSSVPDIAVPAVDTGQHYDKPPLINRIDNEVKAHKKKQSSTSVNVGNIQ